MGIEYNAGYSLLASVTEDAINYISEATLHDNKGKVIVLKNKDGSPNIKSCMHVLGFNTRFQGSGEVITTEEKEIKHRVPELLVRHPLKLDCVQECKLYAGKLRKNYEPPEELYKWLKNINFSEGIMHVVVDDRELFSVDTFGNDI